MSDMRGKVALVTGAGSGLGKVIARLFAARGARVVVADVNAEWGSSVAEDIVNVASIAGVRAHPGLAPYVAAKHGVNGLTKTAAIEYGPMGIRVNSVCPGGIKTPQLQRYLDTAPQLRAPIIDANPLRRLADADEIADAVIWLCSSASSYVNGHELVVDGGKIVSDV